MRPTGAGRARGLVSSRASGRRVDARRYAPPAALADVVESLWTGRWDLTDQPAHETQLLSDPSVHIVFEGGGGPDAGSRVVGVWTDLWRRRLSGRGFVRGAKLQPGAARAFVDVPVGELTNRNVRLDSILGDAVSSAERAVLAPDDDHDGALRLARWLGERRRPRDGAVVRAVAAVKIVAADREIVTVAQLADRVRSTPRALQRLFREYVGATPKWTIRRYRLQEVALRIERGDDVTLADLSAELGYTDQAHMCRDFRAAVGKSPSEFASAVHR